MLLEDSIQFVTTGIYIFFHIKDNPKKEDRGKASDCIDGKRNLFLPLLKNQHVLSGWLTVS